jgi:hypothetical protein
MKQNRKPTLGEQVQQKRRLKGNVWKLHMKQILGEKCSRKKAKKQRLESAEEATIRRRIAAEKNLKKRLETPHEANIRRRIAAERTALKEAVNSK